jgi:hypothetical protein
LEVEFEEDGSQLEQAKDGVEAYEMKCIVNNQGR